MDGDNDDPVIDTLTRLRSSWPGQVWTWDSRFTMLASSFPKDVAAQARACAAQALPYAWDASSLATAPPSLREICERMGGLRAGQLLMAGKAGHIVLVGLWWPWGGGGTITLRLGLGEYDAMDPPYPAVRALFGVS